jgi:hypothetical protein
MCGIYVGLLAPGQSLAAELPWIDTIGRLIKSIDSKHLYEDNSGLFLFDKNALEAGTPDIVTSEYYPHWDALLGTGQKTTPETFSKHAEMINARGKVYVVNEYGWDVTDWPTRDDFAAVLKAIEIDNRIFGDNYWALQAHAEKFGWQPISAPTNNPVYAKMGESGHWWSLFYGGMTTLVNSKEDMQARAEQLRTHAFAMACGARDPGDHVQGLGPARLARRRGGGSLQRAAAHQRLRSLGNDLRQVHDECRYALGRRASGVPVHNQVSRDRLQRRWQGKRAFGRKIKHAFTSAVCTTWWSIRVRDVISATSSRRR